MNKAVIIDDEFDARRVLKKYLERAFPDIEVAGEADSVTDGIKLIHDVQPDFVFLDIKMGDGTGFDLIDQLEGEIPKIIFTTAFDEFAVKAFRYHAIDYLLKPIDPQLLSEAVTKIISRKESPKKEAWDQIIDQINHTEKKIGIPTSEGFKFISVEEIIYFEADSSYCTLFLKNNKHIIISKPLKFFEDKLSREKTFIRPHKSFFINLKYVEEYQKQDGGFLKLSTGKLIPISRNKREEVLECLEKYFM